MSDKSIKVSSKNDDTEKTQNALESQNGLKTFQPLELMPDLASSYRIISSRRGHVQQTFYEAQPLHDARVFQEASNLLPQEPEPSDDSTKSPDQQDGESGQSDSDNTKS